MNYLSKGILVRWMQYMVKNKNVERTSEYEVYICNTDHLKILNNNGLLNEDRYFTLEKIWKIFSELFMHGQNNIFK
jgi:spermidine/putrescine-binding protein